MEVCTCTPGRAHIRDSKSPAGPILDVSIGALDELISWIREGNW